MNRFIDRFDVILLDMGQTFMFGVDRFSVTEDFAATYRSLGGHRLTDQQVDTTIRLVFDRLLAQSRDETYYNRFPQVADCLANFCKELPASELDLLQQVFAQHEIGTIPESHAMALHRLRQTHRLGVASNIWSKSDLYLQEFERSGVSDLFDAIVFSSDHGCIKPSSLLFAKALEAFTVEAEKIVFVGDNLKRDVAGAKAIGLATIWINQNNLSSLAPDPRPDLMILSLGDLL